VGTVAEPIRTTVPPGGSGDAAIRRVTTITVACVGVLAAYVSYRHAYTLARRHGEEPATALAVPTTVDGLILAASMVLLHAARHRLPVPRLARLLLGLGIAATLGANVAHGLAHGPVGALVAAWPAVALVGSYELLMWLVRTAPAIARPAPVGEDVHHPEQDAPEVLQSAEDAVRKAYAASLSSLDGPLSQRELARRFRVDRRKVARLMEQVDAELLPVAHSPNGQQARVS
jgi:hypothetical protein